MDNRLAWIVHFAVRHRRSGDSVVNSPSVRHLGQALQKSNAYETIAVAIIVMMALTELLLIAVALGFTGNAIRFFTALAGGMFCGGWKSSG